MGTRSSQILGLLAVLGVATPAGAGEPEMIDRMTEKPAELEGVDLTEKLGERIPLDLAFRDERGEDVTLAELFEGDLPVILTLNYSDCPMLCNLILGGLTKALVDMPEVDGVPNMTPGRQFRIITVSLDPEESTQKARRTKAGYVDRFRESAQDDVERGWHFLTGDEADIRKLADSVGFGYRYLPRQDDYLHTSAIMVIASDGMVIRYLKGIDFDPAVLADSIFAAGTNDPKASVGFLYSCYLHDSDANDYSGMGRRLMTYVGGAFALGLLAAVAVFVARSRSKNMPESDA